METQLEPAQQWVNAQHQLDHAIENFLESLNTLYARQPSYSGDSGLQEESTLAAHRVLCSMNTRINKLRSTEVTLRRIRNDSTSLVPINRLPLEVLLHIFHLFTRRSDQFAALMTGIVPHPYPKESITLTQVCTHWRGLVINTSSLWSDFYFDVGIFKKTNRSKSQNLFSVYLKHAHDRPSTITVSSRYTSHISTHHDAMGSFLGPYMKDVGILRFLNVPGSSVLHSLFEIWQTEGRPGSVHSLAIFPENNNEAILRRQNMGLTSSTFRDWDSFLLPIRVLRLVGPYFRWDSLVFHNLVVLQFGQLNSSTSPTTIQIWAILSASPQLEFLHLFNMKIKTEGPTHLQPVALRALQVLDVRLLDDPSARRLLHMIISESQELSLSFRIPDTSAPCPTILSFLARTNIKDLFLDAGPTPIADLPLGEYLSAVPDLHSLILSLGFGPGDTLHSTMIQPNPSAALATRYPNLHTLHLMNGSLQEDAIREIVQAHPHLRKLGFFSCSLEPSTEEVLRWLRPLVNGVMHARTMLSEETIMNWFVTLV